jgi:hypothetical protein
VEAHAPAAAEDAVIGLHYCDEGSPGYTVKALDTSHYDPREVPLDSRRFVMEEGRFDELAGGEQKGPGSFGGEEEGPDTLGGEEHGPDTLGGDDEGPDTLGGEEHGPDTLSGEEH